MPFLTNEELSHLGFKKVGRNVRISQKASIYDCEKIEIGDNTRIDDFCVLSGKIYIGRNVHIAVFCNVAGGDEGVTLSDFAGLAYGCQIFSQSDDYSGKSLTNPTVPDVYKHETKAAVFLGRHVIVGACSVIFPGVVIGEGTAVGAMSMVTKSTLAWSIYFGIPAKKIKNRNCALLRLESLYLESEQNFEHK
jgi:galactoside O-acetyltransferase